MTALDPGEAHRSYAPKVYLLLAKKETSGVSSTEPNHANTPQSDRNRDEGPKAHPQKGPLDPRKRPPEKHPRLPAQEKLLV